MSGKDYSEKLLQSALALAQRGWPVFPCHVDKSPYLKGGFTSASTDHEQVKAWWRKWPTASIGVPTGATIGCFVLDVDLPDGPASLSALEEQHGPLPETAEQRTGSGGRQLLFALPDGVDIRNSTGRVGKNLDIRGNGGYIIVPPSGHPSGGHYAWTSPKGTAPAAAPQWLLELALKPKSKPKPEPRTAPSGKTSEAKGKRKYALKVLESACEKIRNSPPGEQHEPRRDQARLVGGYLQYLDEQEAYAALEEAVIASGAQDLPKAMKTVRDGLEHGKAEPVAIPDLPKSKSKPASESHGRAFPFSEGEDGVYFLEEQQDGGVKAVWVCSPLRVLALTRDSEGEEWGRLLEVVDPDGVAHQWAMPMTMLSGNGDGYRAQLMSMGLRLTPGQQGKNRLHMLLSLSSPEDRARCVNRIGWHGRRFVLPDAVYGHDQGERVLLQGGSIDLPFRMSGTLQEWQDQLARYCVGNSRLAFAVSVALAAPLLHLVGAENGGFHLVGASSKGKTTLLQVAGSVCGGGGLNGFLRQWRATSNGLEAVAAAHCDSLLCLDEMSQVAAREAGEVAYMLSNGQGKTRAARTGEGRKPAEWRILFLSTGEITLADKIREDGRGKSTAGQAVRVVDIPADAGRGLGIFEELHHFRDGDQLARHLKDCSRQLYGTPLRAFLEHIAPRVDDVAVTCNAAIRGFQEQHCPPGSDGQVVRVAGRFALAAAAGEQGIAAGILPWPKGEAHRAASACFVAWLDERGGVGAAETEQAIAQVRAFIEAHGSSRFEDLDGKEDARVINRAGYRQKTDLQTRYCFFPETFKREVCSGLNLKTACQALLDQGFLVAENGRFQRAVRTADGNKKLYIVTSAILSGNTGNTGNRPENTDDSLFPVVGTEVGTLGTDQDRDDTCSHCSQFPESKWEQENANDSSAVPTVPTVPTKKEQAEQVEAEPVPASYPRGEVLL